MNIVLPAQTRYVFDFGGGTETIVADGTEQPGHSGTILLTYPRRAEQCLEARP